MLAKIFLAKNAVNEHRAVQKAPVVGFTTDMNVLAGIRAAVASAKKIYLVTHGDPRTTDMCYTNNVGSASGVHPLASAKQLAAFLAQILTSESTSTTSPSSCATARAARSTRVRTLITRE